MKHRTLMGIETEYACAFEGPVASSRPALLKQHLISAAQDRVHLPDPGDGVFFENGARFYVDHGLHPEYSTPECSDPWELVRHARAGDRIMHELSKGLERRILGLDRVLVFRSNVDYSGSLATWGCHESYLCSRSLPVAEDLVPHLCSRIIFTGAGGFDVLDPGIEFRLSPRARLLQHVVSGASTHDRGIFHTKDESLSGGNYKRLHLLCGECNCSDIALWLKVATTSLVARLVELGRVPSSQVRLKNPVLTMRWFARDPTLRATAKLASGQSVTALELQRRYLALLRQELGSNFLPEWAVEVYHAWRRVLDDLEADPESAGPTFDWAIKYALFRRHADRRGFAWDELLRWTWILRDLHRAWCDAAVETRMTAELALAQDSPIRRQVDELKRKLRHSERSLNDLGRVLDLRDELFEIDTRFGQLGDGIFNSLDDAGVLDHRVEGVGDVAPAMSSPPSIGRAVLRGQLVRDLATEGGYACDWDSVWGIAGDQRRVPLDDPFATEIRWVSTAQAEDDDNPLLVPEDFIARLRRRRAAGGN